MREVAFYRTKSGNCPIEQFLDSLTARQSAKVTWTLGLIEDLDVVPKQNFKKLTDTDDIWEIRVKVGRIVSEFFPFLMIQDWLF